MFDLKTSSDPKLFEAVMNDFPFFMIDHAACERKKQYGASFPYRSLSRSSRIG